MNPTMAAAHREAFLARLDGGVAVLSTGPELVRSRDTHYKFRPDSDFWYLTAFPEPDAVAVLAPDRSEGRFVLFVRPRDPEMETWNGRRAGVDGAKERYGADEAHPIEELDQRLPDLLRGADRLHYRTGVDPDFDRKILRWLRDMATRTRDAVRSPAAVIDPGTILHEMRLRKSPEELAILRRASDITAKAHLAAMKALRPETPEYAIESLVDGTFRAEGGWGPGYATICAGGANACVLHYTTNDMTVRDGDLLLLDAGCEVDGYTADVTRCTPASGTFAPAQRDLYEVVLAAQVAACDQVTPGATFASVHEVATARLVAGMIELELLQGTLEENLESKVYRRYYMHRTSHWLGLDVHDVGAYATGGGTSRELEPGMVLTVEPAIYVTEGDELAPERFRGIGVRIEDDVAVTESGREILTAAIPKTVADVEAAR